MPNLDALDLPPPTNWQDFERLCCDLWRRLWRDPEAQMHGRQGQPQAGVDVFGRPYPGAAWAGVQCKLKASLSGSFLTAEEIEAEVEKAKNFRPPLATLILATTGPSDTRAQEAARLLTEAHRERGLFAVRIASWSDIVQDLASYPDLLAKHFPQFLPRTGAQLPPSPPPPSLLPPRPPPHHLERSGYLLDLKKALLAPSSAKLGITAPTAAVGVQGMGGIGKSVLAADVARDPEVQAAFSDGVFWLTVGQQPDLLGLLSELARALGDTDPVFPSAFQAKRRVSERLSRRKALVVLDDVWTFAHGEALDVAAGESRLLLTTRNREVLVGLGATEHRIEVLDPSQALALLARWAGKPFDDLPPLAAEVAKECGYLPLALAMAGAMVRLRPTAWEDALARLRRADLEALKRLFPDYPYPDLLRALEASVDGLEPAQRDRYLDLAVFPEDATIPLSTVEILWSTRGLAAEDARDLATAIVSRSLAAWDDAGRLRLHDLQGDYLRKHAHDLPTLHRTLVEAYRLHCPNGFASGPDDGYYFQRLPYHLARAGMATEIRELLFDFAWITAKLAATDVNTVLVDYEPHSEDAAVGAVEAALRLSAHILARDASQLASQLLGRLMDTGSAELQSLLAGARTALPRPGLRPAHPYLTPPGPLRRILAGPGSAVSAVAALPGERVISGSWDGALRIWDIRSGSLVAVLQPHLPQHITAVALLDSHRVASGSWDKTVRVWDLRSRSCLAVLQGHTDWVLAVAPSGPNRIISGANDRTLRIWDLHSGSCLAVLEGHTQGVTAVAPLDPHRAISGSGDHTLRIWDLRSGACLAVLRGHTSMVHAVTPLGDHRVLSASEDRTLRVWDLHSGSCLAVLQGHTDRVIAVALLEPHRVISASADETLRVWDLRSGSCLAVLEGHTRWVTAVVPLDPHRVVSASLDETLRVWDLRLASPLAVLERHSEPVTAVAPLDSHSAVSASYDHTLRVWDLRSRSSLAVLQGHSQAVTAVAALDSHRVVSASHDRTLRIWDCRSGTSLAILEGHTGPVEAVAALDPHRVISASTDRTLRLWDLRSRSPHVVLRGHTDLVSAVAPLDPHRVVSASYDYNLRLWDLRSGSCIAVLEGRYGQLVAVAPLDPLRVVSASLTQTLQVWDLRSGSCVAVLEGHTNKITAVAPLDPQRVVSTSEDHTLRLWDLTRARQLAIITLEAPATAVCVMPDRRTVVAFDARRAPLVFVFEDSA